MKTYASFFEHYDKSHKEMSVVEELIKALNYKSALHLHSPQQFILDPPDCICLNASDELVAIEVTEVVCQEATRLNAQGKEVVRNWRSGDLIAHIEKQLYDKDAKSFHGGPYKSVIACLFTDEPLLTFISAEHELKNQSFGPFEKLSHGFLLFSYDPSIESYPLIELNFR